MGLLKSFCRCIPLTFKSVIRWPSKCPSQLELLCFSQSVFVAQNSDRSPRIYERLCESPWVQEVIPSFLRSDSWGVKPGSSRVASGRAAVVWGLCISPLSSLANGAVRLVIRSWPNCWQGTSLLWTFFFLTMYLLGWLFLSFKIFAQVHLLSTLTLVLFIVNLK